MPKDHSRRGRTWNEEKERVKEGGRGRGGRERKREREGWRGKLRERLSIIIPRIVQFDIITLNFHRMIDIHSKHYNMHKHIIFYTLICIHNHIILCKLHISKSLGSRGVKSAPRPL